MKRTRLIYILLAIFLGCLGIHNFYAGYTKKGIIQLLCCTVGGVLILPLIVGLIWILVDICTVTKDADGKNFS